MAKIKVINEETGKVAGYVQDSQDRIERVLDKATRRKDWNFDVYLYSKDSKITCTNAQWVAWVRREFGLVQISNGKIVEPATAAQVSYLNILKVAIEPNMSKSRAGELIDAAKNGMLGSVNGFYTDGSN